MPKESTIQHYTSSTTGNTPAAIDLALGELAINIADERIFFENINGTVLYLSQTKDLSGAFASSSKVASSVNGFTGAVQVTGSGAILQTVSGTTTTFGARLSTTSVTGVASFNNVHFTVDTTGHVKLGSAYQVTGQTVVSGGPSQLVSTSGNTVTIDNRVATSSVTGVASFNGTRFTVSAAGAVDIATAYQVTGDTIQAGSYINIGAGKTINNIGVRLFNGLTGAVSFTPTIASTSVTGVASFSSDNFAVSAQGVVTVKDGGIANVELVNSSITIKAGSAEAGQAISLGSSFSITGTANQVSVSRSSSEFTIGLPNDIIIPGNLTVNGNVVTANVDSFVVEDSLFMLGTGNASDSVDIGFYGQFTSSGKKYAGMFRDASDSGKFKFFTGLSGAVEPTTFVNDAGSGYTVATVVAKIDGGTF